MSVLGKLLAGLCVMACAAPMLAQESGGDLNSRSSRSSSRSSRDRSSSSSNSNGGSTGTDGKQRGETVNDKDRRRESRSKERESNSRSSRRSESKSGEKDAAAAAKPGETKDTKTVQGSKPAAKKSGSSGGQKPVEIKFEMQADPETNIMYLEAVGDQPSLNISVMEKKKFITRLALYNPKSSAFSQVDASIKFDPQLIRPVGVDDSAIQSNLAKPARILVDSKLGLVSMAADFSGPRTDSFLTLARIQWEALEPVASTPISFLNTQKHPSGVFTESGENILHYRSDGTVEMSDNAGLLDASVSIEATDGTSNEVAEEGNPFSAVALATNINSGTAEGGIRLSLSPHQPLVQTGQDFLVDIIYQNPKRADMDTIKLKLRFDPEILQVVDYDEGNWITRGVNIFDGAYHDQLPFDNHRKNQAYNTTGLILYDHGFGSRTPVAEEGRIATIKFRAVAPAASTPIMFVPGSDGSMVPETAISFLGFNLIGKPGERSQFISNASVSVRQ